MRLVVGERGVDSKILVPDGAEKATGLATWLGQVLAAQQVCEGCRSAGVITVSL